MKKTIALLACAAFLLSGCSAGRIGNEVKQEVKEEVQDIKEDINEITPSTAGTVDKVDFIGEEKAKEIALSNAGIEADSVMFDRVELENDNGMWQYEIEFRKDRTEYNADINAVDGEIISWEVDND